MGSGNSPWKWVREHLPGDFITIGILVFLFGFFGSQISLAMGMFAFSFGLLLFTWHVRMRGALRALIYLAVLIPCLYWFDKTAAFLFPPATTKLGTANHVSNAELMFRYGFAAAAVLGLIIVVRHSGSGRPRVISGGRSAREPAERSKWSHVPAETFKDVGGMREEKRRIAAVVNNRLHPEKSVKHGVTLNGILLYGPRGTGKTFIARATAGEFKINFWQISPKYIRRGSNRQQRVEY